jgi:xylulokinase
MTLVLSVDWSADATSVSIIDTAARSIVGEGRSEHAVVGAEHDPEVWWASLVEAGHIAVDAVASLGLTTADVRTITLGTNEPAGGLVALGADGSLVHPALVGSHTDSGPDASWLISHTDGGSEAWDDATGILPTAGSTVALLSWLHRSAPDAWSEMTRLTLPIGLLTERLGGEPAIGIHVATGTAVLDRREPTAWRTDLLSVVDDGLDWTSMFPRVVTTARPVGLLSTAAADALGLPYGIPLHTGPIDIH